MTDRTHIARIIALSLGLLIFLVGCAGSGPSGRSSEFDPFGFPGDDSVVTAGVERTAVDNRRVVSSTKSPSGMPSAVETETVILVQFFATTNYAEAEDVLRRASKELEEPVAVTFETPYYKLKAGPLTSRAAADRLALRLRAMGYEAAWVVTEQVPAANKK